MRIFRVFLIIWLVLTLIGPLYLWITNQINFHMQWQKASRKNAGLAPLPQVHPQALVQLYAAQAFNWRGLFAVHTWIAVKPKNAKTYTIYQVVGWNSRYGLPVMMVREDVPDRYWFGAKPQLVAEISGVKAEMAVKEIMEAAEHYPYPDSYQLLPGPNSNTFTAYLLRSCAACNMAMPGNAVGQYYLPHRQFIAPTPSHTGYELQLAGLFGIAIGKVEGIQLNILGLGYGINPWNFTITLPGVGTIGLKRSK